MEALLVIIHIFLINITGRNHLISNVKYIVSERHMFGTDYEYSRS